MIPLTNEELEFLCEFGEFHEYEFFDEENDEYEVGVVHIGEKRYIEFIKQLAPDALAVKLQNLSSEEMGYLKAKINYFTEHPLEIPYQHEWEPPLECPDYRVLTATDLINMGLL